MMIEEEDTLDEVLVYIGEFGRSQLITILIIYMVQLFHESTHLAYVFTAMDSDYRCSIPECNDSTSEFEANWTENAIPLDDLYKPSKCTMYYVPFDVNSRNGNDCSLLNFDRKRIIPCNINIFKDDEYYIGREFGLLCEKNRWILSLVGTANMAGMFLGLLIFGILSDKYGRKLVFLFGTFMNGIVGMSKTFVTSFRLFCILEFVAAFFSSGSFLTAFIIGTEMVSQKKRKWMAASMFVCSAIGDVWLCAVAWKTRNWGSIIYFTSGPCMFMVIFGRFVPESIRWYLSKGEIEKPIKILKYYARNNGKRIPESYFNVLNRSYRRRGEINANISFALLLKSPSLLFRLINCNFLMIAVALLFYGITLNSVSLAGHRYLNFVLVSLMELPAYFLIPIIADRIGNRELLAGSFLITSASCLAFIFIDEGVVFLHVFIYCLGKFGATVLLLSIYTILIEMFPTPLRQTALGITTTIGRVGCILSPQVPLLSSFWKPLPLVIFASVAGLAGLCSLFLPNTKDMPLPDTIEEAEKIGKQSAVVI